MKTKELKPNRNNIETFLPIFKGFYGTHWDEPDFYGEAEHYNLPKEFDFYEYMNWAQYKEDLCKAFVNEVESQMSEFIETIQFQSMYSPQYYNFSNDSINCIIRPKKQAIKEYIYKNIEAFKTYLKEHLKSRDGFISFHSYHFEDWKTDTKDFTDYSKKQDSKGFNLGFILDFIATNENLNDCLLYADSDIYPSSYLNEEFSKIADSLNGLLDLSYINEQEVRNDLDDLPNIGEIVQKIEEFIHRKYTAPNLKELVLSEFDSEEYTQYIFLDKIVESVCNEVESHNLKLEFANN